MKGDVTQALVELQQNYAKKEAHIGALIRPYEKRKTHSAKGNRMKN